MPQSVEDIPRRWPTPVVLPLTFDKSISLLEKVDYLVGRMNEIIATLNDFENNANDYTDEQISNLKNFVISQISILQDQIDDIIIQLDTIDQTWEIRLKQMYDRFQFVLNLSQDLQNNNIYATISAVRSELIDIMVYGFLVIDPTTGKTVTVQIALDNLYNSFMQGYGLSVDEYEALNLIVDDYETLNIRVYDYTFTLKEELFNGIFSPYFDPFTGLRAPLQTILDKLASFHIDTPTVQEYEDKNLTVDAYEALNITVENYATAIA